MRCGMCGKAHPGRCDLADVQARVAAELAALRTHVRAERARK